MGPSQSLILHRIVQHRTSGQISMPGVAFEPTIPMFEGSKSGRALLGAATGSDRVN
jgi:hypothetical protein